MTEKPARKRRWFLFSLGTLLVIVLSVVWLYKHSISVVMDCYIQERVAEMLIEHMERNGGVWPRNWDELVEAQEICEARGRMGWTLEEIRERCAVDFTATPSELVTAEVTDEAPPFRVVRLVSGKSHNWSGGEPNLRILEYLKSAAERPADYLHAARPVESERAARKTLLDIEASWRLDQAGHIVFVHMGSPAGSPRFTDAELKHVATLSELRELILDHSNISDDGLVHLSGLTNLRTLYLSNTHVSDKGMQRLANMHRLEQLTLELELHERNRRRN